MEHRGTYLDDGQTRFPGYRGLGVPSWQLWARHRVNEVRSGSQLSRGIGSLVGAGLSLHALWVPRPASRAPPVWLVGHTLYAPNPPPPLNYPLYPLSPSPVRLGEEGVASGSPGPIDLPCNNHERGPSKGKMYCIGVRPRGSQHVAATLLRQMPSAVNRQQRISRQLHEVIHPSLTL